MKPSDFFLGVMEFLSILLPGALLAYLLTPWAATVFGPLAASAIGETERWLVFAVAAYMLGHLLHHLGSFLDRGYDRHYVPRKRRFGDEKLLVESKRWIQRDLGPDLDDINLFEWAGAWVRSQNPAAAAELERAGGESKFFRSVCLVAAVAVVVFTARGHALGVVMAAALAAFSYRRFCDQRWKATQTTYTYFVLLRQLAEQARAR